MKSGKKGMTKVVGLTGGIGSGKSTIARIFSELGVPVYIADAEAKKLMVKDLEVKEKIIALLGANSYENNKLNRAYIADQVFGDKELLSKLNAIVHPAVAKHFKIWKKKQESPYVIKEAAILFENGGYKACDYTILVTAPKETRIKRILARDKTTRQKVLERMQHQWDDEQKRHLADFIIVNEKLEETFLIINRIHNKLSF